MMHDGGPRERSWEHKSSANKIGTRTHTKTTTTRAAILGQKGFVVMGNNVGVISPPDGVGSEITLRLMLM